MKLHLSVKTKNMNCVILFMTSWTSNRCDSEQHSPNSLVSLAVMKNGFIQNIEHRIICFKNSFSQLNTWAQPNNSALSFLSYGGYMSGWAATSTGNLKDNFTMIRTGEYGGPLILFDEEMENYILFSPLNNFMVSNWETGDDFFSFGLLGSVENVPRETNIKNVMVWDSSLRKFDILEKD